MKLIDKDALVAEIERQQRRLDVLSRPNNVELHRDIAIQNEVYCSLLSFINTLEVKEVDLEKESESIANGIMISVQSNKYGTNIYNAERNDFNHYHLRMAARKGIELGLKINQK